MRYHVDSEAGRLRRVILHRPDLELSGSPPATRTPCSSTTCCGCAGRAPSTTASPTCCATAASRSTSSATCSPRPWTIPQARALVLDRVFDEKEYGPLATDHLRAAFDGLARRGTGRGAGRRHDQAGVPGAHPGADLGPLPRRWTWTTSCSRPLPNHLFTRDTSAWIYDGVGHQRHALAGPAARDGALRGDLPAPPALPRRAASTSGPRGRRDYPSTIEGGDVLVIGNGAVLIGMSERTTPQAVEMLAHKLFAAGSAPDDRGPRHAQAAGLHAPRHRDDDGRRRHLHPVRRARHAPLVHHRAGRRRRGAEGHRPSAGAHAPRHRRRARAGRDPGAHRHPGRARRRARAVGRRLQRARRRSRVSSSPTSATPPPTPICASRASRSSRSPAASWAGAGAVRAA